MKNDYQAVIVGGGVIGSSIAYYLAKQGMKVALLEQGRLAAQASGAAAGMLAAQAETERPGPLFDFFLRSRRMFPALAEELKEYSGIDIGLVQRGLLKIAINDEEEQKLRQIMSLQHRAGEKAKWFTGEEVRQLEPELNEETAGAVYFPDDGQVSAPDLSMAFAKSAAVLGAHIREFAEVQSILLEHGRAVGVRTRTETVRSDRVIIASGVWSGGLLKQAGVELPLYPVKGECFSVITPAPLVRSTIFAEGCYLVPKRGGRLVVGATMHPHSYDRRVTFGGLATLMDRARRLLPSIAGAEWEKAWSGLRPQTADGMPYLGACRETNGLYLSAGHYRNGILLSPITGVLAARWAADGVDEAPAAFRADRAGMKYRQGGEANEALD